MEREGEMDEAEAFDDPLPPTRESLLTTGRIANIVIAVACFAAMICCIVCLAVMAHKHNEVISNTDPGNTKSQSDKEVCILYATTGPATTPEEIKRNLTIPKWNRSHTCQFVIFGSSFVAGLLFLAIGYYIVRVFIMRSINPLVFLEITGFGLLLVVMFSIAVVVSAGRAYTCDRLKKLTTSEKCSDVRVFYNNDPTSDAKPVYIYSALKTSEVSAWISFLLLLALVIVSVVKMVIWFMRISARRRDERQLDNLIAAPENDDDDDEPLPM